MEDNPKLRNSNAKAKERHLCNSQTENPPKRNVKIPGHTKNDLSQSVLPQNFDANSSVKKIFNEANKIVKIGIEKELALQEKSNTLQNSNETIDNLRKNILHLQMEYEKLDQNYQREISNRTEIVKRMDATKDIVESIAQYSNTLASSIKLLEDDKCRIAEYYELIYQGQKEIEAKHVEAEKFTQQLNNTIQLKIENLKNSYDETLFQNSEAISQLKSSLSYTADKLKITGDENEKLQAKIKEFQEVASKMEVSLQTQYSLNISNQEVISKLKCRVKKLKNQRFKCQRLLKNKKKKISILVNSITTQRKNLEKMEDLLQKSLAANKVLESQNCVWETKFENQLKEETLRNQDWEARVTELTNNIKLSEMNCEELKNQNNVLMDNILELTKNEKEKEKEMEDLQNDLSKMLSSNLHLQEDLKKLNDETTRKENEISHLESKMADLGSKLNSETSFYQNEAERYQELAKKLENQLSDSEKKLFSEKNQKEILMSDYNSNLENLKMANEKIINLEKLLENKEIQIKEIEFQQTSHSQEGKKALEKLNKDVQVEKIKNQELSVVLENLENSYSSIKKELQEAKEKISDFEEKLKGEKLLNKELKGTKDELEKSTATLKKEIECDKSSIQQLQNKHRKAERELTELREKVEENSDLKSTIVHLQNTLKATEARLEAYKVVVRKLENEKAEKKYKQVEEGSTLKSESSLQQKTESSKPLEETHKGNFKQMENELVTTDTEKWNQAPSTPVQDSKKFLTTPRKIFTSTPQPGFQTPIPFKKKRDPYEFDSDSSVERLDAEKVMKIVNRQRKEPKKKSKTNK